jgi:hypothetical protein
MAEEHAVGERSRPGAPYALVLSIPTLWWVIASGALHNFNMYALGAFLVPFLIRFHGVGLAEAGTIAMVVYGFSGIVGLFGGGIAADALYRRRVDGRLLVATAAFVISTPSIFLALGWRRGDVLAFSVLMGLGIGVMYAYYSTIYATVQDIVEPVPTGHGDGALLLRDVPARRIARSARYRRGRRAVGRRGALRRLADDGGRRQGRLARRPEPVPSGGPAQRPLPRSPAGGDPLRRPIRRVAQREGGRPEAAVVERGGGPGPGASHTPGKVITPRAFSPRSMSAKA